MKEDDFVVGHRYRNRHGWYEVISRSQTRMHIRYDDGSEDSDMPLCIAARIHNNMEREESVCLPDVSSCRRADLVWTIGALARHGDLQAEVPPQAIQGFLDDYADATGVQADCGMVGLSEIRRGGDNKWGSELRIYFPAVLARAQRFTLPEGITVVSCPSPSLLRINNNGFWWHLVRRLGFRAGNAQDKMAIVGHIPIEYRQDFFSGYEVE